MPAPNVDLVFVIDASDSMQPCFDALRAHLDKVIQPMQGHIYKVRFGLVAQSAGADRGVALYDHQFLCGSGPDALKKLYMRGPNDPDPRNEFFTEDSQRLSSALAELRPKGNEDMLVALDVAADFPFGPSSNTKRVIALFSDEPFEGGVSTNTLNSKIPELIKKLQARHIQLFIAIPDSDAIQQLAEVDRSEVELVAEGGGLHTLDFTKLLGQMGKSISASSLQSIGEPAYFRALFGQDRWGNERVINATNREVILKVGEAATLDTSKPLENIRVRMDWTLGVTFLDIYAYYRVKGRGIPEKVYWAERHNDDGIYLSADPSLAAHNKSFDMTMDKLNHFDELLIAANIFNGNGEERWSDYDGQVVVETNNGDRVTVRLTAQEVGEWCIIARIDNKNPNCPQVININRVSECEPTV